jgi:hypothetical protein
MTDSTTSEGWLRKTNFSELGDNPLQATVRLEAARMHAMHYMTLGIREYSQWFKGEANMVADALSCENNRSDKELTHIFRTHCPSQIPQHFEIQPLPNKIILWLTALLLKLPMNPQYNEKHTRTKLGCGTGGHNLLRLDWTHRYTPQRLPTLCKIQTHRCLCRGYARSAIFRTIL